MGDSCAVVVGATGTIGGAIAIATIERALPGPVRGAVLSVGLPVRGSALTVAPDDLAAAAERLRAIATAVAQDRGVDLEEVMDEYRSQSALRSLVTVDQVAWGATLLFDREASALHGSTLALTAGRLRGIF
jgi:hypothetical protein